VSDSTVDLTPRAGLDVRLDERSGELMFGDGVTSDPPGARMRADLATVLREPAAAEAEPGIAYHLYRAVRRADDEPLLAASGLRYDLTVTLPGALGPEHAKTAGHYHPQDGDGVSFPEVYEVVQGRSAFVLQRVDDVTSDRPSVEETWVQVCEAGERIVIPPDCGHVTVNVGAGPLVVANLISLRCGHLYGSFAALRGAAWYLLVDPDATDGFALERNPRYAAAPYPHVAHGSRWEPFLADPRPSYAHVRERPEDYRFLDRPASCAANLLALWA
jgi:glucose-6-phosphate isomerase